VTEFSDTGASTRSMGRPGQLTALRRDGTEFPIEATISKADVGGGRLLTVILRDVSERLQAEREQERLREDLRRYAAELETRVEQRTRALSDVNAELNAFAYSVSHDLRTPLRSTQGFAQALLEDYDAALDATGKDYARRIVAASRRMDDLIQDLLAYSRLSRADMELQRVDLGPIVRSAATLIHDQSFARRPEIDIEEGLPAVLGHPGVLSQVLQNLIGNAVKFVPAGTTPHVRVTAEREGGRVTVSVTDNGIGVPVEYQERIFRVFERLHPLDTYPGTGIGLAIVRKGAERLGGRCGVESGPGGGSRFWIELAAADAGPGPSAAAADVRGPAGQ
jgi:signal transduction histidine kinase